MKRREHELRKKRGLVHSYHFRSAESLERVRQQRRERIPWNKDRTGVYSKESLKSMSNTHKQLRREGLLNWNYGKHTATGSDNPMYGKHQTESTKRKQSEARRLWWVRRNMQKNNRSKAQKKRRSRIRRSESARAAWARRKKKEDLG
jgi:hypothetical protein